MRVAVLGGTRFVGRHIVEALVQRGIEPVLFHRGQSGAGLFEPLEHRYSDRREGLSLQAGDEFDVIIDTCAYRPEDLQKILPQLHSVSHYIFISTVSVYADPKGPVDETSPTFEGDERGPAALEYGARKVECETLLQKTFGSRLCILRPGILAGPWDPTDRFTWWLRELRQGLPHHGLRLEQPVQFLDARDLANFVHSCLQSGVSGVYNLVGPRPGYTALDFLHDLKPSDRDLPQYVEDPSLMGMPFALPKGQEGIFQIDCRKAVPAGFHCRRVASTVEDTLNWMQAEGVF